MNKSKDTLIKRQEYICKQIASRNKDKVTVSQMVSKLAEKLFLSEETIWKDLSKGQDAKMAGTTRPSAQD